MIKRLIIGLSGSSAPLLGIRLLEVLQKAGEIETHLILSATVAKTLAYEAPEYSVERVKALAHRSYDVGELASAVASGSFPADGMIVMPCSMKSLAAIAIGMGDNLLTRAADVTLKERRPLVLVPRETPLNLAHLRNMVSVTEMGGIILPPMMAFYHQPKTVLDLVDHTVGKVLDIFKIPHELFQRWQGPTKK